MDARETKIAIATIQRLNQHNENLCQQVQDLIVESTQLRLALERAAQTMDNLAAGFLRGDAKEIARNEVANIRAALKGADDE